MVFVASKRSELDILEDAQSKLEQDFKEIYSSDQNFKTQGHIDI